MLVNTRRSTKSGKRSSTFQQMIRKKSANLNLRRKTMMMKTPNQRRLKATKRAKRMIKTIKENLKKSKQKGKMTKKMRRKKKAASRKNDLNLNILNF